MNIALIGYGKMGKAIEEIALQRGHTIVLKIDVDKGADQFTIKENLAKADVAIEFTGPHSAKDNILKLMQFRRAASKRLYRLAGELDKMENTVQKKKVRIFLYASNFSVGVNIFFEVNKRLAELMKDQQDYEINSPKPITTKKDAPSGTAITLAEQVLHKIPRKTKWVNQTGENPEEL